MGILGCQQGGKAMGGAGRDAGDGEFLEAEGGDRGCREVYWKCSKISEMQVEMEGGILAGWDGGCRRGVLETGDSQRCCRGQIGHFWGDGRWNPPSL